ncbi:hypothetical protein BD410DRAFT_809444 [Rickenella mellea]|uniref:Uncharacterized protein n=1 Tax=Rickenella mellea TaxID=50990 RepID=A0A4Y7PH72_9AGAM|nr:hypothetical protein BD410DRAFT_809444 [Rickenella mellea]
MKNPSGVHMESTWSPPGCVGECKALAICPTHPSIAGPSTNSRPHRSTPRGRDVPGGAPDRTMAPPAMRPIPANSSAPPDAPLPYPNSFEETDALMEHARRPGEADALATMARLSFQAQHCPARLRSHVEIYAIRMWRNPGSAPIQATVDNIAGLQTPAAPTRPSPRQSDPFPTWLAHYERFRSQHPSGVCHYHDGSPVRQDLLAWYVVMRLCPNAHRRGSLVIHSARNILLRLLHERGAFRRALAAIPGIRVVPSIDICDPLHFPSTPSEQDMVEALTFRSFYAQFIEEYLEPYAVRLQAISDLREAGFPPPSQLEDYDLPSRTTLLPPIVTAAHALSASVSAPRTFVNFVATTMAPSRSYHTGPPTAPLAALSLNVPTPSLAPPHPSPSDILMAAAPASPLISSDDVPPPSDVIATAVNSAVSDDALMADIVSYLTNDTPVGVAESTPLPPLSGELGDDSVMFDGVVAGPHLADG